MIKPINRIVSNYLLSRGYKLNRITKRKDIIKLLKSLYPYRTQYDLVRLGPKGDGGYLVPNCLDEIEICFSPGVSDVSGFELDCIERGMFVFMADKSVEKPNLPTSVTKYNFIKKFIGSVNDDDFITMDEWVNFYNGPKDSDLLLQMDIEGAEYDAFTTMSESLIRRFKIMVIEFHFLDKLWEPSFFKKTKSVFDKILKTHVCVHNHPNNCCGTEQQYDVEIHRVIELTFLRKDCIKLQEFETLFPNALDYDNTDNESLELSKHWYASK